MSSDQAYSVFGKVPVIWMLSQEVSPSQSIQKFDQEVLLALFPTPFLFVLGASAAPASHQIGFLEAQ